MSRNLLFAVSGVVCLFAGSTASGGEFQFVPELFLYGDYGPASNARPAGSEETSVTELELFGSGSLRWYREFADTGRFFQFELGGSAYENSQDAGPDLEPGVYAGFLDFEVDLDVSGMDGIKRATAGLSLEYVSIDYGDLEFGISRRLTGSLMLTDRVAKTGSFCETATWVGFVQLEDFEDRQNRGDPVWDRTDDGGYYTLGFERTRVLGTTDRLPCERAGVFRRQTFYNNPSFRWGVTYRREATAGSAFDAHFTTFHFGGQRPTRAGMIGSPVLEGHAAFTRGHFSGSRTDKSIRGGIALRWPFTPKSKFVRNLDLLLGTSFERRDSLEAYDYDRWSVFFGIDTRFGKPWSGDIPSGGSQTDHRGPPGGSDPEVEGEIDPDGGGG